jgi:hypothetical protein
VKLNFRTRKIIFFVRFRYFNHDFQCKFSVQWPKFSVTFLRTGKYNLEWLNSTTREYVPFLWIQIFIIIPIRGDGEKSLARTGRKQATATKLGIYLTYSPRSSIYFLAPCPNFCEPLKKIRMLSVKPGLRGSNELRVGRKMATLQLFFQARDQEVVRRGQVRRTG